MVSFVNNGSQGGNGLLNLLQIARRELETWGDWHLCEKPMVLQSRVSGLHLVQLQEKKETKSGKVCHNIGKEGQVKLSHHLVGASNLEGSTLGKKTLGEGVKLPEFNGGRFGFSLPLDCGLPQLVPFGVHLLKNSNSSFLQIRCHDIKDLGNFLFSRATILLNLDDRAIQGGDGLSRLLLSPSHGNGVAGNLVLKRAGDLDQGAEGVARVLFDATLGTNGFSAGLAVTVDFVTNMFLAARDSFDSGVACHSFVKGDLLVACREFSSPVRNKTSWSKIFLAIYAVHCGILFSTSVAWDHSVDIPHVVLDRLDQ